MSMHCFAGQRTVQQQAQQGFSLPEMMVAVALMALLVLPLSQMLKPALDMRAKVETDTRLEMLRTAALGAYRSELALLGEQSGAVMALSDGSIAPVAPNASGACPSTADTFLPLQRYLQMSARDAHRDGWGQGLCVLMTSRQTATRSGVAYQYHNFAFVSPGRNGAIDAGTALTATSLTLGDDDKGVFIDGRTLVSEQVDITLAQVKKASDAMASYFSARYLSNSDRDTAINYFARSNRAGIQTGEFDFGGAMPNTQGQAVEMTSLGIADVLGLNAQDLTNPWGGPLLIDNSSDAVRTPENSQVTMRQPPFTARVGTVLPGGAVIVRTAVGTY